MVERAKRDITGLRVGMLVAKSIHPQRDNNGATLWYCECDCGGSILKPLSDLVRTKFSSCGCVKINPTARKDHTGIRYGKVVGVSATDKVKHSQIVWKWKCDCGEEFESVAGTFVYKSNGSCPRCAKDNRREATSKCKTTHGMSKSKEHKSWCKIKERCLNPNDSEYKNYGAVGIKIFEQWAHSFEEFIAHIGVMPKDGNKYSCDRIDNSKGYEPGNVRWATAAQQARNKGKMKNNTSGVTGVLLDEKSPGNFYYVAYWNGIDGVTKRKSYSVKKYGEELAFFLACEKRDLEILRLNVLGAGYSPMHGK